MFTRAGMLSPEGRCRTLDAAADGCVRAEAVGLMVLEFRGVLGGSDGQQHVAAFVAGSALATRMAAAVSLDCSRWAGPTGCDQDSSC